MKIKLALSIAIGFFALNTTTVQASTTYCDHLSEIARTAVISHHKNIPITQALKSLKEMDVKADNGVNKHPELIEDIVESAYKKPKYRTEEFMLKGAERHARKYKAECSDPKNKSMHTTSQAKKN